MIPSPSPRPPTQTKSLQPSGEDTKCYRVHRLDGASEVSKRKKRERTKTIKALPRVSIPRTEDPNPASGLSHRVAVIQIKNSAAIACAMPERDGVVAPGASKVA